MTQLVEASKRTEVIFDFSGVTGIDSSAGACFAKIRDVLCKNSARQVMAALSPTSANILSASTALDDRVGRYDHLDEALEEAEEMLLAAHASSRGNWLSLAAWLEEALGSCEFADELCARLTPAPRRRVLPLPAGRSNRQSDLCRTRAGHGHIGKTGAATGAGASIRSPHVGWRDRLFFLDVPRSASLLAASDAVVWSLCRDAFESLKKTQSEQLSALFIYIIRLQSERLTFANRQILALQR